MTATATSKTATSMLLETPQQQHSQAPKIQLRLRNIKDLLTNFLPLTMEVEDVLPSVIMEGDEPDQPKPGMKEAPGGTEGGPGPMWSPEAPRVIRISTKPGQTPAIISGPREPRNDLPSTTPSTAADLSAAAVLAGLRTGRTRNSGRATPIAVPRPPPGHTTGNGPTNRSTTTTMGPPRQPGRQAPTAMYISAPIPGLTPAQVYRLMIYRINYEVQGIANWMTNHQVTMDHVAQLRQAELRLHHLTNMAADYAQLNAAGPASRTDRSRSPVAREGV